MKVRIRCVYIMWGGGAHNITLPFSQFLRLRRICTHLEDFDNNSLMLATHFHRRGYPNDIIESATIWGRRLDRDLILNPPAKAKTDNAENLFLIDNYHPGGSPSTT